MKVTLALEARLVRHDGTVYSANLTYGRFWQRYLSEFDEVLAFARVTDVARVPDGMSPASGPGVRFLPVPFYHGPAQFLKVARSIRTAADQAVAETDAVLLRVPGLLGTAIWKAAKRANRNYAVEVVGDPWDVFAPGGARVPFRPIVRQLMARQLRQQCRDATAALYVTREALQRRYPSKGIEVGCSDVALDEEDFADAATFERRIARTALSPGGVWHCVHIGTMDQTYKRQDLLIRAVEHARAKGLNLKLTLVGEGKHHGEFRELARTAGVEAHVDFTGRLAAGPAIRDALDAADLFVLPSSTEGLPRVLLEAMARGLPCLATDVGGIPELVEPADLFPIDSTPEALADRITKLVENPQGMTERARRNYTLARDYHEERLAARRQAFYRQVKSSMSRP